MNLSQWSRDFHFAAKATASCCRSTTAKYATDRQFEA
jgi:hypothetical protein